MTDRTAVVHGLEPTNALSVERVRSVRHWNEHLFSFTITRPPSFRFRSGEFVMIGLPGDNGKPLLRAYSIASPAYAEELEFLSIKVADGPLTSKLQQIVPGDELYLGKKPTGTLVTDALKPGQRLFMLSTGTGLAPFLSLIRDPDVYDMYASIVVVHSVRRVSDLAFRTTLEANTGGRSAGRGSGGATVHLCPHRHARTVPHHRPHRRAGREWHAVFGAHRRRAGVRPGDRPGDAVRIDRDDPRFFRISRRVGVRGRVEREARRLCDRAGVRGVRLTRP